MLTSRPFVVLALFASVLAGCIAPPAAVAQDGAEQRPEASIPQFMQDLRAHGRWFTMKDRGWVWQPNDIEPWWVPYTHGTWRFTTEGPYWESAKPYGWAVFHYGRWLHTAQEGWVWIPDTTWGPGFVCWRYGKGYLGWAPMPPMAAGDPGIASGSCNVPTGAWSFAVVTVAFDRYIEPYIVPRARNVNLLGVTTSRTDYQRGGLGWVDRSIPTEVVRELPGMKGPVASLSLRQAPPDAPDDANAGSIPTYAPIFSGKKTFADVKFTPASPEDSQANEAEHPANAVVVHADALRRAHEQLMQHQHLINSRLRMMHVHDMESPPWKGFPEEDLPMWHARELQQQAHEDAAQRQWVDQRFLVIIARPEVSSD